MRNTGFKVLLFLCTLIALSTMDSQVVRALSDRDFALTDDPFLVETRKVQEEKVEKEARKHQENDDAESKQPEEDEVKPPTVHTVLMGESLSKIADQYQTTWQRLFDKNVQIENPDIVNIGDVITIPEPNEELAVRQVPASSVLANQVPRTVNSRTRSVVSRVATGARSAGNTYAPGYCTWYAKNRRPDLPNRMGNASAWVASAAAHGFATGTVPRVGAIGQQGNHVVYVEQVNGDGTVTVSEMNYRGLFVISSRVAPAASFRYIYY